MRRGPLAESYPGAVALVVCSLIPYLALSAAILPLAQVIAKSVHMSLAGFDLTVALSTGAYAAGTVLAVQLAVHLPPRRLLVLYEALLVIASALAAWAPTPGVFVAGFVVQGLCTSLMLIAAVPPLVTSWPARKMPTTGAIMNLCIFGAVALGPTLGALQLAAKAWRPLFWGVAGVAVLALLFSLLTYEDDPPSDPEAPWDLTALGLAVAGCAAAFFGAGKLQASLTADWVSVAPLIGGVVLLVGLVVHQYRARRPLMPVRSTATTVPTAGVFIALMASAAAFGIMELALLALKTTSTPLATAGLFVPEFAAAILIAGLFGALFRTRFTPLLALGGLLMVVASAALLLAILPKGGPLMAAVAGLLGLGVAASVSPALFMAGFSLESRLLQRVFALIELLRGVTAFLLAPILVFLISVLATTQPAGMTYAIWICLGIAAFGFVGGAGLYLSGKPRLEVPDIEAWQGAPDRAAWSSPPLLSALRVVRAGPAPGEPYPGSPAAARRRLAGRRN